MEREIRGNLIIETFSSLRDFHDTAQREHDPDRTFIDSEITQMVDHGWAEHEQTAMEIAEAAVTTSEQLQEVATHSPVWDVAGSVVDVGRYLSGEPECMIDFPLEATVKAGRIITLVSSADSNAGSDWLARGLLATSLGLALAKLGYGTEMWADNYGVSDAGVRQYQRILVKSTSDEIDASRLMFAFGHTGMLDPLAFGVFDGYARTTGLERFARGFSRARGAADKRTDGLRALYPEGTIFLTGQLTDATRESARIAVEQELRDLGLLPQESE